MRLGLAVGKKAWCLLCGWEGGGEDCDARLLEHLNADHGRVLITKEEAKGRRDYRGPWNPPGLNKDRWG